MGLRANEWVNYNRKHDLSGNWRWFSVAWGAARNCGIGPAAFTTFSRGHGTRDLCPSVLHGTIGGGGLPARLGGQDARPPSRRVGQQGHPMPAGRPCTECQKIWPHPFHTAVLWDHQKCR